MNILFIIRWRQSHGTCANCVSPSQFGYSREPESKTKDIAKLCLTWLATKLKEDYKRYEGRALVVQPAIGFPCYVFQMNSKWADGRLAKETNEMFSEPDKTCNGSGAARKPNIFG